jgi:hypothetical protein
LTPTVFPNDENGEVLRSMAEQGIDLTVPREVDFAHLFPDENDAQAFAARVEPLGYRVEVYEPDEEAREEGSTEWDVLCARRMVPTHADITRFETQLAAVAREFGGHEDGWGFMAD